MNNLLKRWRSITIGFLLITYLTVVVFMQQSLGTWFIIAGCWIAMLILLFFGTFVGILGILLQTITRRQEPSIPLYRLSYKLGTKNATILASYGLLLLREENAEEGLRCFERALESSNYFLSTKTLLCNRGIALWKLTRIDEAIDSYLDALKKFGQEDQKFFKDRTLDDAAVNELVSANSYFYPQDYTTLGFLYTLAEKYEEATFFSKAALIKQDNYAAAYDNLGQIAYYKDNLADAKKHFKKALELKPSLPDSLYFSGMVAIKEGNAAAAKQFLEKAKDCQLDGLNTISYHMIDEAIAKL